MNFELIYKKIIKKNKETSIFWVNLLFIIFENLLVVGFYRTKIPFNQISRIFTKQIFYHKCF